MRLTWIVGRGCEFDRAGQGWRRRAFILVDARAHDLAQQSMPGAFVTLQRMPVAVAGIDREQLLAERH